ncbi:porin family protein [Acidobacteria bacterium AB60]|nr:porin family protein [Acidobacteria bacterium AB60]
MIRKWLVSMFALVCGAALPAAAFSQVAPDRPQRQEADRTYKYLFYAGAAYTSLNQVNQSRYGLVGGDLQVSREFGRFFAITADGSFYQTSTGTGNPGNPQVDAVLFGPELHGHVFEHWSVFIRALLGGEHTGGEGMTPNISFAGGAGGGVEYDLKPRWVLRLSGDEIAASFSVKNNNPGLAYSPHTTRNSRASIGIGYRF